jgi:hypothetical protein
VRNSTPEGLGRQDHWRFDMSEHVRLGKVSGFPVSVHWSVLVILWLFTWSLASTLPHVAPG